MVLCVVSQLLLRVVCHLLITLFHYIYFYSQFKINFSCMHLFLDITIMNSAIPNEHLRLQGCYYAVNFVFVLLISVMHLINSIYNI